MLILAKEIFCQQAFLPFVAAALTFLFLHDTVSDVGTHCADHTVLIHHFLYRVLDLLDVYGIFPALLDRVSDRCRNRLDLVFIILVDCNGSQRDRSVNVLIIVRDDFAISLSYKH